MLTVLSRVGLLSVMSRLVLLMRVTVRRCCAWPLWFRVGRLVILSRPSVCPSCGQCVYINVSQRLR